MAGIGDPVFGEEFINREEELATLERRLNAFIEEDKKRNIAILGLRKVGKTSLIGQFIRANKKNPKLLAVQIYVPEENPLRFVIKTVGSLLLHIMRKRGINFSTPIKIEYLTKLAIPIFPKTSQFALEILEEKDLEQAFVSVFELFRIAQKESGYNILIVFDEFQRVVDYKKIKSPIDIFREKIMNQNKIMYIVAGSSIGMLNKIVASSESPLYGHFEIIKLKGFDFKNSRKLIINRLNPISIGEVDIGFLFEITDGIPFYIDLLTFRMKDIAKENGWKELPSSALKDALVFEAFSSGGSIYSHLTSFIDGSLEKKGFGRYLDIMKSIAKGNHRSIDISKGSDLEYTQFSKYIKQLIDLDIVVKKEDAESSHSAYHLCDTLLELWLREVYTLREDSIIPEITEKRKRFESRIEEIINEYKSQIGLGNEARIRELFSAFDGKFSMYGKMLPRFVSVLPLRLENNDEIDVHAVSPNENWFAEVKDKRVDTAEILKFMEKLTQIKTKIDQKIIVSLFFIDEDAQKLALKNGIAVWNLGDINTLMKTYSKFRIFV